MNETIDIILRRRSIRKYKPTQVKDSDLHAILECAIHAPSAINRQKWHFSVIQSPHLLKRMVEIIKKNIPIYGSDYIKRKAAMPGYDPFYGAPTVILISAVENMPLVQIDCGLAAQNITLAAESLNLGSCIIASSGYLFASEEGKKMKKELGIPEGYEHVCSVLIGYKDEAPPVPERKRDVISYIR